MSNCALLISVSILATREFQCELCGISYCYREGLSRHRQTAHFDNGWPHKCEVCGMGFKIKNGLYEHRKRHTEYQHSCKQCGKAFRKRISLRRHLEYHSGSIVKPFVCDVCSKPFRLNFNLVVCFCFQNGNILKFYENNFESIEFFHCRNIVAFIRARNHMHANIAH